MVTIYWDGGCRVFIHLNEAQHRLPHVHVETSSGEVVVALGHEQGVGPRILGFSRGTKKTDARAALRSVEQHEAECRRMWEEYHGA